MGIRQGVTYRYPLPWSLVARNRLYEFTKVYESRTLESMTKAAAAVVGTAREETGEDPTKEDGMLEQSQETIPFFHVAPRFAVCPAIVHLGLAFGNACIELAGKLGIFLKGGFGSLVGAKVGVLFDNIEKFAQHMVLTKDDAVVSPAYKAKFLSVFTQFRAIWTGLRSKNHKGYTSWDRLLFTFLQSISRLSTMQRRGQSTFTSYEWSAY